MQSQAAGCSLQLRHDLAAQLPLWLVHWLRLLLVLFDAISTGSAHSVLELCRASGVFARTTKQRASARKRLEQQVASTSTTKIISSIRSIHPTMHPPSARTRRVHRDGSSMRPGNIAAHRRSARTRRHRREGTNYRGTTGPSKF